MIRLKATTFVPPSRLWVVSRVACIQPCSPTESSCVNWSRSDAADPATQATEARRSGIPVPRSAWSAGSTRMGAEQAAHAAARWRFAGARAARVARRAE